MISFDNVNGILLTLPCLFAIFQPPETNIKTKLGMFEHEELVSKSDNDAGQKQKSKNRGEEAYLRIYK